MTAARLTALLVSLATLAACTSSTSGGGRPGAVSLATIRSAEGTCPLPLADAAHDAGHPSFSVSGAAIPPVSVNASPSAGTVLEQVGGVSVDCTVVVDSGTLDVTLVAATKSTGAAATLLPAVAAHGKLGQSAIAAIAGRIAKTKPGALVSLGVTAPVALGVVTVEGARSAAFELHGSGVSATLIAAIAKYLAKRIG